MVSEDRGLIVARLAGSLTVGERCPLVGSRPAGRLTW